jgi:hypothetical protein
VPITIEGIYKAEVDGVAVVRDIQSVLDLYSKLFVVVLKIINPVAGLFTESLWVIVNLGGKKPFVVELTSNCAEGFTLAVDTPIPTWAFILALAKTINNNVVKICFFIFYVSLLRIYCSLVKTLWYYGNINP